MDAQETLNIRQLILETLEMLSDEELETLNDEVQRIAVDNFMTKLYLLSLRRESENVDNTIRTRSNNLDSGNED